MPLRKRRDATGADLRADVVYQCIQPYSAGRSVFNYESRLRGDSDAVLRNPSYWAPDGIDSAELARLRVVASIPAHVDHSAPQPKPIPVERQAVATETFWASSGAYIRKGTVLPDDAEVVKAHSQYFVRPPRPLEAA